mmetsp:Transcript_76385/g.132150  ORF Transcript_76385/g.132150 Transcript_76385/m.132150 type:complete len:1098 (+) Transcript_76385:71-3364(+)
MHSAYTLFVLSVGSVATGSFDTTLVDTDKIVCNDAVNGPHGCPELSDEISMMQGGLRVSHASKLEAAVQHAVQKALSAQNDKIASSEKALFEHVEELKQNNDQLRTDMQQKIDQLRADLQKKDDKIFEMGRSNEQMNEKMSQLRLSYGMLVQVCQKGFQGLARTSKNGANITVVAKGNKQKPAADVRTSEKTDNVTLVAMGSNQKFAPDVVDATVDAANTVADTTVDAANAVADAATDVYDTVSDLPGDVADWTLEQLENLKSLIGLDWTDIPGLQGAINSVKDFAQDIVDDAIEPIAGEIEDAMDWAVDQATSAANSVVDAAMGPINAAIDAIEGAVDAVKDFAVDTVNIAIDTVKDWISILEDQITSITDYVTDLYNKYLKPIIMMIWECAKEAKSPIDFVVCVIKPVLEKLLQALVPLGSVAAEVPFPFDDEALTIDPATGVYTMKQECYDCVEGDIRDLAPLACEKKELDFLSIFKVTAHACNVPFMPGQCGGSLMTCLKQKASRCAKGALLWGSGGVLSRVSEPVEEAMQLTSTILQNITHWTSEARALYDKAKAFQSSTEAAVMDVYTNLMNTVNTAKDTKDAVIHCLKALSRVASAGSISKMTKNIEDVIASVEELIALIENLIASIEAVQTSFDGLTSSTEAEVQDFYTRGASDMAALKSDIEGVRDETLQLYENSKGVAEELLEDFQEALATPVDQLENLGDFMLKCAMARDSYQKVYVDLEVATLTAGRLLVHERDGVKLAYVQPQLGGAELYHEEWPWSSLETKTGQKVELCVFVYCVTFKIKVRKNPSNILGLPIQVSDGLDDLKWFELEYEGMFYDLNVIGVPYKFDDPTGLRFPSITIPILLDTSAGAQNPSTNPSDASNTLWHLVDENKAEAQQIADGLATAPGLPASAASGNDINTIKAEVDEGLHMEESSIEISDLPGLEISALPWGLQDGDIIAVQAAGHHSNTYLGLCPLSGGTCDGNTHKAFAMTEPSYWQVVLDTSTTFYLRKPDQDNAYLGLCGISNAGCDNDQYGVYGYPTKRDRAKWEFEIDAGNVAYLKASGHHGAAPYVGFCGNFASCGSSKYGSFSYTKVSRTRFQIDKV